MIESDKRTAKQYAIERTETVHALRELCKEFGDNDWSDDLHLADVIEKHLARHLRAGDETPDIDQANPRVVPMPAPVPEGVDGALGLMDVMVALYDYDGQELDSLSGYRRRLCTFSYSLSECQNTGEISWTAGENDWPEISHIGLFEIGAPDKHLAMGELAVPIKTFRGDIITFPAGTICAEISDPPIASP